MAHMTWRCMLRCAACTLGLRYGSALLFGTRCCCMPWWRSTPGCSLPSPWSERQFLRKPCTQEQASERAMHPSRDASTVSARRDPYYSARAGNRATIGESPKRAPSGDGCHAGRGCSRSAPCRSAVHSGPARRNTRPLSPPSLVSPKPRYLPKCTGCWRRS